MFKFKLVVLTLVLSTPVLAEKFSGSWRMNPIPNSTQTFDLYLLQTGESVCGLHFGSARGGAKIDSSFGSDAKATISGVIEDGTAEVILISSHTENPIVGKIQFIEGILEWTVADPQEHRIVTIPKSAKLKSIPPVDLGEKSLDVLCE